MTGIKRVIVLYNYLKKAPSTAKSLSEQLSDGSQAALRQIYRDLKDVAKLADTHGERLIQETDGRYNRKIYKIQSAGLQTSLSEDDLDTYFISRAVLPSVFTKERALSLDRLQEAIRQRVIASKAVRLKTGLTSDTVTNTHFYENKVTSELDGKLKDMLWAVGQQVTITITHLSDDATSAQALTELPAQVQPVKIVFHRGCFYVVTVRTTDQRVLAFQIDQLTYETGRPFRRTNKLMKMVEANLNNRFGITQNIDNEAYNVELRFSTVTGRFVSEQFWHHSQNAEQVGADWLITFHCGINRELVGWLFQWMSNVKIIGPPKLKELYDEQLARMLTISSQLPGDSLDYTNAFAPKT